MNDGTLITVCSECLCASCWHGIFYCEKARNAGTTRRTVADLRALAREHPSYWELEFK